MPSRRHWLLIVAGAVAAAIAVVLLLWLLWPEATAREALLADADAAGLLERRLLVTWREAADASLRSALPARASWREVVHFDPARPAALAYRLHLQRGQRLLAWARPEQAEGRLLLELLDVRGASPRVLVASGAQPRLSWRVRRDGDHVLRVQPEPLGGGRWELTVEADPVLRFPVEGRDAAAVISPYGVARDGGSRRHLGVDIAAPRGTAALAAADGLVTRVEDDRLGGRVVWLYSFSLGLRLYYAHLDEQLVRPGQWLRAGAPVGRVGNTGNAAAGSPHLHFAVLDRAALDPLPLLVRGVAAAPEEMDATALGWPRRTAGEEVRLRRRPEEQAMVLGLLPRGTALEVMAARGAWLRVRLPDGGEGWIARHLVEPGDSPLGSRSLAQGWTLRHAPRAEAVPVGTVGAGSRLQVLARWGDHLLVRSASGSGWLLDPPP